MIELFLVKLILLQTLKLLQLVTKLLQLITLKGRKKINLSWLFKFLKLSQEISSLFVSMYTSFPLSISWICVMVTDSVRTREE